MEVSTRRGCVADAASISGFITPLAEKFIACEFAPDARSAFLATFSTAAIERYLRGEFRYHIAEIDGAIVGVAAIRGNCHLYHLFVAESAHRSGIGRRLWEVARGEALAAGHRGDFTVKSSNFAVGFYERLGFVRDGPEENQGGVLSVPMRLRSRAA